MSVKDFVGEIEQSWRSFLIAVAVGCSALFLAGITKNPIVEPLVVSLLLGMVIRLIISDKSSLTRGSNLVPRMLIPIGIMFYGLRNLNFAKGLALGPGIWMLIVIAMVVYIAVICIAGVMLGQKKVITFLTAIGSAICGASAVMVATPALDADSEDVSISLLAITMASIVGLFIVFPFLSLLVGLNDKIHALFAGAILQFTGFVKVAIQNSQISEITGVPKADLMSFGLSIKALRYLALLILVPAFASMMKKKIHIPWFLWTFLGAAIVGTLLSVYAQNVYTPEVQQIITTIYNFLWATSMAAIGLNADMKALLSNNGAKAIIMAFAGFLIASVIFLACAIMFYL